MRRQQPVQKNMPFASKNRQQFDALKGLFGKGGGPAAPEGWAGIADKAIEKPGQPLGQIGLMIAQRAMMQPPAAQPQPARPLAIEASPQVIAPTDQPTATRATRAAGIESSPNRKYRA